MENDGSKACKILNNPNKVVWIDKSTLNSALLVAVYYRDRELEVVWQQVKKGADINYTHGEKLHCWLLLKKGRSKLCSCYSRTAPVSRSETPLFVAAARGHEEVVHLLLNNAAPTYFGIALSAAANRGHKCAVCLLLKHGANVNNHQGSQMPLCKATEKGMRKLCICYSSMVLMSKLLLNGIRHHYG
jgi:ankyrin repeat protein